MAIKSNELVAEKIPGLGEKWVNSSLLWNERSGNGLSSTFISPVDQSIIQTVSLLSENELERLLAQPFSSPIIDDEEFSAFCLRLSAALDSHATSLEEAMKYETAFISSDCRELMEASKQYVKDFLSQTTIETGTPTVSISYEAQSSSRQIHCEAVPWGTIAVVLPQNAFLLVAVTCLLNAMKTGNRVILRAPLQSSRSAAILANAIDEAGPPQNTISLILAPAKDFLEALYRSNGPCLIHYMGSSQHAPSIIAKAFQNGKGVVIDGQGNGMVYVAEDACIETAVKILTEGAIRYNGQTCTSVNGAIIAPNLYPILRDRLQAAWKNITCGNPLTDDVQVGPLFDPAQAANCLEIIHASGGKILCGGQRQGNLLQPTLVESPEPSCMLVTDGVFGCALWISSGSEDDFISCWSKNKYPLCAGIISPSRHSRRWHALLGNVARVTLNGDPSVEYLFEPWGGYPASGLNTVSQWSTKYQRIVQVDQPEP